MLQFNDKFEISDDLDILKQIGMLHGKLNLILLIICVCISML